MIKEKSVLEIVREINEKERIALENEMEGLLLVNFDDAQVQFCLKNVETGEWDGSIISVIRDDKVYTIFGNKSLESNLDELVGIMEFCIEDNRCQVRKIGKEEKYIKSILQDSNIKYNIDIWEGSLAVADMDCEDYVYFDCITDVEYSTKRNELTIISDEADEEVRTTINLEIGEYDIWYV